MVTHPSANRGLSCLTLVFLRELVFPTWYSRSRRQSSETVPLNKYNFSLYLWSKDTVALAVPNRTRHHTLALQYILYNHINIELILKINVPIGSFRTALTII